MKKIIKFVTKPPFWFAVFLAVVCACDFVAAAKDRNWLWAGICGLAFLSYFSDALSAFKRKITGLA